LGAFWGTKALKKRGYPPRPAAEEILRAIVRKNPGFLEINRKDDTSNDLLAGIKPLPNNSIGNVGPQPSHAVAETLRRFSNIKKPTDSISDEDKDRKSRLRKLVSKLSVKKRKLTDDDEE